MMIQIRGKKKGGGCACSLPSKRAAKPVAHAPVGGVAGKKLVG
jgi:hypothetical protein